MNAFRRQRQAVCGLCLLGFLLVADFAYHAAYTGDKRVLWELAFGLGLFYAPPLVSAFRHWAAFS